MKLAPVVVLLGLAALPEASPQRLERLGDRPVPERFFCYPELEGSVPRLACLLEGASGPAFLWSFTSDDPELVPDPSWTALGVFALDAHGCAQATLDVPPQALDSLEGLSFRATYLVGGRVVHTPAAPLEHPLGDVFDFDWGLGGIRQSSGTIASDVQPWADFMTIRAVNGGSGPAEAILFDSGHPTGGDDDLASNLGMLLVIAADILDGDGDGRVDVPRSEPTGGTLVFEFGGPTTVGFVTLVDLDEPGAVARTYDEHGLLYTIPLSRAPDNGLTGFFGGTRLVRLEIDLPGTGGVGAMQLNPCEGRLNFDQLSTGVPADLAPGRRFAFPNLDNAYLSGVGLFFVVENNRPDHPDVGVVFDSSAPTGGDDDLVTPGYGIGNDAPLGRVLVIAEDEVDADGDGLIDDPDDEAQGGVLHLFGATTCVMLRSVTVLDIDEHESAWIVVNVNGTDERFVIPLQSLGDNSVQTVTGNWGPTRSIELHLSGSGALAEIVTCPL